MNFPSDKVLEATADFALRAKFDDFLSTVNLQVDEDFTSALLSGELGTPSAEVWKLTRLVNKLERAKHYKENSPLYALIDEEIANASEVLDSLIDLNAPAHLSELRRMFKEVQDVISKPDLLRAELERRVSEGYTQPYRSSVLEILDGIALED